MATTILRLLARASVQGMVATRLQTSYPLGIGPARNCGRVRADQLSLALKIGKVNIKDMAKQKKLGRDYPLAETPDFDSQGKKVVTGSRPDGRVFKTEMQRTTVGGIAEPYKYSQQSIDTSGYSKGKPTYQLKSEEGEGDRTYHKATKSSSKTILRKDVPSTLKSLQNKK